MEALAPFWMALLIGAMVLQVVVGRRRVQAALDRTFKQLSFSTPEGSVAGSQLRVVKVSKQGMPLAYDDVFMLGRDPLPSDSFWYCVGPGPSYHLAIPVVSTGFGRVDVQWIVRPLTAERMRAALLGDERAIQLAFDEATEA